MTPQITLSDAIESTIASLPAHMQDWVRKEADLCNPDSVEIITGKADQIIRLENELEASGAYTRLDENVYGKRTFYARSDKNDVARVEERTVICTEDPVDAAATTPVAAAAPAVKSEIISRVSAVPAPAPRERPKKKAKFRERGVVDLEANTLVGTKAKNRPLSVLREGYWTAYGDRSSKVKYGSSPAPAGAGA